jgi:hypothetical protein
MLDRYLLPESNFRHVIRVELNSQSAVDRVASQLFQLTCPRMEWDPLPPEKTVENSFSRVVSEVASDQEACSDLLALFRDASARGLG